MKRNLLILSFIVAFVSAYSQTPLPPTPGTAPRSNSSVIPEDYNLSVRSIFLMPRFVDTTLANTYTKPGFDSCGRQIFTFTDNKVWVRKCSPKRWEEMGGVSVVPTFEQVLNAGSELLTSHAVNGQNNNFVWEEFNSYIFNISNDFRVDASSELNLFAGDSIRLIGIDESATTGLDVLLSNPTTGALTKVSASSISQNIYNTNGTLTGDRILDGDGNDLYFDNIHEFHVYGTGGFAGEQLMTTNGLTGAITLGRFGEGKYFQASDSVRILGVNESATTGLYVPLLNPITGAVTKIPASDIPINVNADSIGTVFNYNWGSGSFGTWTDQTPTVTITASAGQTAFSGGAKDFTNYIEGAFFSGVPNWSIYDTIIPTNKNGTSYGPVYALYATNANSVASNVIYYNISDTAGWINISNNASSYGSDIRATNRSVQILNWSTGDTFAIKITRRYNILTAYLQNITTGQQISVISQTNFVDFSSSVVGVNGFDLNQVGKVRIFFTGGDHNHIGHYRYAISDIYRPDFVFVGNSITTGADAENISNSFVYYTMRGSSSTWINCGGPGETSLIALNRLDEVLNTIKPVNLIYNYGVNDANSAVPLDSFGARVRRFIQPVTDSGVNVIIMSLVPQSVSVVAYNDTLQQIAADFGLRFVEITSTLKDPSANTMRSIYFSFGDNIHPNNTGHYTISTILRSNIEDLLEFDGSLKLNNVPITGYPKYLAGIDDNNNIVGVVNQDLPFYVQTNRTSPQPNSGSTWIAGSALSKDLYAMGNQSNPLSADFRSVAGVTTIGSLVCQGMTTSANTWNWNGSAVNLVFTGSSYLRATNQPFIMTRQNPTTGTQIGIQLTTFTGNSIGSSYKHISFQNDGVEKAYVDRGGGSSWDSTVYAKLNLSVGSASSPTAKIHIAAGSATASTAPLKFTSGTSLTTEEAGAMEFTTDDLFFTITTGTARKRLVMADPVGGLTSGQVAYATTNGRLTGSANVLVTGGGFLQIGASGSPMAAVYSNTASLDFPSTAAGTSSDLTITVTGAALNDVVTIGVPNGSVPDNGAFFAWVSATNTVTIRYFNNDLTNAKDPAIGTFRATVTVF